MIIIQNSNTVKVTRDKMPRIMSIFCIEEEYFHQGLFTKCASVFWHTEFTRRHQTVTRNNQIIIFKILTGIIFLELQLIYQYSFSIYQDLRYKTQYNSKLLQIVSLTRFINVVNHRLPVFENDLICKGDNSLSPGYVREIVWHCQLALALLVHTSLLGPALQLLQGVVHTNSQAILKIIIFEIILKKKIRLAFKLIQKGTDPNNDVDTILLKMHWNAHVKSGFFCMQRLIQIFCTDYILLKECSGPHISLKYYNKSVMPFLNLFWVVYHIPEVLQILSYDYCQSVME